MSLPSTLAPARGWGAGPAEDSGGGGVAELGEMGKLVPLALLCPLWMVTFCPAAPGQAEVLLSQDCAAVKGVDGGLPL